MDFNPFGDLVITDHYDPKYSHQIIRVPIDEYEQSHWDDAITGIFWSNENPRLLYIDELTMINPSVRTIRPALGKAIRTGRSKELGVWIGSQRPKDIPSAVFTEAEHFFIFKLQWKADREKVETFTLDNIDGYLKELGQHRAPNGTYYSDFIYYYTGAEQAYIVRQR